MKALDIAVVGAGIGGLAAASLLAQDGHRVHLIERFDVPRPIGSGLVIQPVGLAVLDALGPGDLVRNLGAPLARMIGHSGRALALDVDYARGSPGTAIHRASLFHVLWHNAQSAGVTIVTSSQVTSASSQAGKHRLHRVGQSPLGPYDLIVDASGAGSLLSPLQARPLPFGAIWGQVPWPKGTVLPTDQLTQRYQAARRMAGVLPIGRLPDDPTPRAAIFWSLPAKQLATWHQSSFDDWRADAAAFWPEFAPFIAQLTDAAQMTCARYGHGSLRKPYGEGIAFIGDSAHRASPQLGQGANMALLDAAALCVALRRQSRVDLALPHYAQMRRRHRWCYQSLSAAFTPMYQSDSRLLPILRDHVLGPIARLWPMRAILTQLVSGTLVRPLRGIQLDDFVLSREQDA
jgi:2-polyprenyl-6-methoxyphenol hydroxylase-like FAD-dependent oxidoreductase